MGLSGPKVPAEIPAHPISPGYEVGKLRLETLQEAPNTRTMESSLEKPRK